MTICSRIFTGRGILGGGLGNGVKGETEEEDGGDYSRPWQLWKRRATLFPIRPLFPPTGGNFPRKDRSGQ